MVFMLLKPEYNIETKGQEIEFQEIQEEIPNVGGNIWCGISWRFGNGIFDYGTK